MEPMAPTPKKTIRFRSWSCCSAPKRAPNRAFCFFCFFLWQGLGSSGASPHLWNHCQFGPVSFILDLSFIHFGPFRLAHSLWTTGRLFDPKAFERCLTFAGGKAVDNPPPKKKEEKMKKQSSQVAAVGRKKTKKEKRPSPSGRSKSIAELRCGGAQQGLQQTSRRGRPPRPRLRLAIGRALAPGD